MQMPVPSSLFETHEQGPDSVMHARLSVQPQILQTCSSGSRLMVGGVSGGCDISRVPLCPIALGHDTAFVVGSSSRRRLRSSVMDSSSLLIFSLAILIGLK